MKLYKKVGDVYLEANRRDIREVAEKTTGKCSTCKWLYQPSAEHCCLCDSFTDQYEKYPLIDDLEGFEFIMQQLDQADTEVMMIAPGASGIKLSERSFTKLQQYLETKDDRIWYHGIEYYK